MSMSPWKRRKVKLSFTHWVFLEGVLSFGVGIFIFNATNDYLQWMSSRTPSERPTVFHFVVSMFFWAIAGGLWGAIVGSREAKMPSS
jgi:hypothetical protein